MDRATLLFGYVANLERPPTRSRGGRLGTALRRKPPACRYLSAVAIAWKVAVRLVPPSRTAVMITTEMSAAIRPYSMAVAPLSSRRNAEIFDIDNSLDLTRWSQLVVPCTARFVREKSEEKVL